MGSPIGRFIIAPSVTAFTAADAAQPARGSAARTIPFELEANVIFLRVGVNGSPPLSFILDTGGYLIINTAQAKSIGLALQRVGKTDSIGAEPQDVHLVGDKADLTLSGLTFRAPRLLAIGLDKVQECIDKTTGTGARRVLDGILGKEFFSSFVVEIDYPARVIRVYDPSSYRYSGAGTVLPLEMAPQHVFVRAHVGAGPSPIPARLLVDTGAATGLRLTKKFTDANNLLPPPTERSPTPECGLGGYATEQAWLGTVESVHLGDITVRKPVTVFSQQSMIEDYDGFLGGGVLSEFKVVFDYSRRQMILERSSR